MSRPGARSSAPPVRAAGGLVFEAPLKLAALALMIIAGVSSGPATVRAAEDAARDEPRAASPAPDRGAQPERDADPGDRPGSGARVRPRSSEDGERAPRADEGCPYRGRKLDLIV